MLYALFNGVKICVRQPWRKIYSAVYRVSLSSYGLSNIKTFGPNKSASHYAPVCILNQLIENHKTSWMSRSSDRSSAFNWRYKPNIIFKDHVVDRMSPQRLNWFLYIDVYSDVIAISFQPDYNIPKSALFLFNIKLVFLSIIHTSSHRQHKCSSKKITECE